MLSAPLPSVQVTLHTHALCMLFRPMGAALQHAARLVVWTEDMFHYLQQCLMLVQCINFVPFLNIYSPVGVPPLPCAHAVHRYFNNIQSEMFDCVLGSSSSFVVSKCTASRRCLSGASSSTFTLPSSNFRPEQPAQRFPCLKAPLLQTTNS